MDDLFDDFLEYDVTMGADEIKCPNCGKNIAISLFFDETVECGMMLERGMSAVV